MASYWQRLRSHRPPANTHRATMSSSIEAMLAPATARLPGQVEHSSSATMTSIRLRRPHRHHPLQRMSALNMSSLALLLCYAMCCCDALSIATRRIGILPHYHHGHDRVSFVGRQPLNLPINYARSRVNESRLTELSLFRRSSDHPSFQEEVSPTESNNNPWKQKSKRRRTQQILGQLLQKMKSKISLRKEPMDDTINTGRQISYASTLGAAGANIMKRGARQSKPLSQTNNPVAAYSSTAARMARVQSFANSPIPLALTSTRKPSTALHMVLSTPDTIIEQASTKKLLDTLLDESVRTQSRQPIMMQFNPSRSWIWRQWRGTVFSETWKSGLLNMALATLVVFLYSAYPGLKDLLQGFEILWGQLLSVTTFTLTFFLNQSYGLWRKCYDYSRRLQGRLNDLGMTLAAHACRNKPSSPDVPSTYTPQSRQTLELVSRYVRVFNLLTYASFTRSHRPILTPRGMRRLVERGILTPKEQKILSDAEVPATQRHNAVLVWLIRLFLEGMQTGVFEGGMGFEQQFMEKCHVIRAQYGAIGDELQGRMPLAYAHIVQVLLDVVLWMYPFMALSTGMAWHLCIVGTGLLTMFYQGLFDLAKQFLDPYDNENYGKGDDPLTIDTLIAETNAGSVRWMNSFQQQPWNKQLLNDGELYDSILPLRGYSVEDLEEMEAQEEKERQEREAIIKEKKLKEEENDRQKAEQLLMGHIANIETNGTSGTVVGEKRNGTAVLTSEGEVMMSINVDGGNKTLMEVSGGEVVATSSLLPPGSIVIGEEEPSTEPWGTADNAEMESNKVLTLADGTLVTSEDDDLIMNTTITAEESNMTTKTSLLSENVEESATLASDIAPTVAGDTPVTTYIPSVADSNPPLLGVTRPISWASLGATPNFDESIAEMEKFSNIELSKGTSSKLSPPPPSSPLFINKNENVVYDQPMSGNELEDFKWFEEIGEDGQEYRLSQMLADEDWPIDEEDSANDEAMTYEEFTQKATEIIEQAESELKETQEIMSVSPGNEAEYDVDTTNTDSDGSSLLSPISSSPVRRSNAIDEPEPLYDQTKLDPISQLWGAPPGVLENMVEDEDAGEELPINDGMDFRNVYSLWGEDISGAASLEEEESSAPSSSPSMDGFSQLWNENLSPYRGDDDQDDYDQFDSSSGNSQPIAYAGLEWWDEVTDDGKEVRLSQMLADEEYQEEIEEEVETPMTFEQFAEETEKLIEQAEDERKETEAIMNAPPNANFLEEDEDFDATSGVEESIIASDRFKEMIKSLGDGEEEIIDEDNEIISDEEIDFLQMDDFPEIEEVEMESNDDSSSSLSSSEDEEVEGSGDSLKSEQSVEPINIDND